ncbi:hypothetical protein HJG54_31190 [Leptolyngbya sp. NK1-12]|uniref:Mobilization protein MobC n=1 Tax=Leptolyngbya sp. NK1-12 TaxID=2547451 RepID=A0AA96WK24_9CYAN|nr:hypothetical protein [Leptolyngbya sp. NK1-12]WNZ27352.1 hypothetical protein HJG54_31190 [Leptolyngbya sp. NK1-12]
MISTTRRSPNATLVSKDAVNQASQILQELPEKPKEQLSLREVVDALRGHITAALDKGYSYEDITAMLAAQGVVIAPSSLKHYLARSNRQAKAKGSVSSGRRSTETTGKAEALETLEAEVGSELDAMAAEAEPTQNGQLNGQSAEAAPTEAPEAAPKRGRRPSSQKQAETKTTRSSSRTSSTRKRRSSAS